MPGPVDWGKISYYVGATGSEISEFHKIWIIQDKDCVVGYLGEGTSREIVSNWDAPFADSSLESKFRVAGGLVQMERGYTSLTKTHSRQVWTGNQPYTFNLVMKFRAFTDALTEVEDAIETLESFMAPDLVAGGLSVGDIIMPSLNSRAPLPVQINFGRKQLLSDCCIRSMSTPYDKEKDKNGNLIRADVSLQVETLTSITRADLGTSRLS